jgi:Zn-dependent peptidase ImmA (M78 family)/DNA-binding XRE family transcriptional regulator
VTGKFNSRLLLLARQYRAMSQGETATTAGMNQGHYSRIENGLLVDEPTVDSVERIARVLRFPTTFFFQEDGLAGLPLSVHAFNRKKSSISEKMLKQVHAELNIRIMHLRRYLNAMEITPDLPKPLIDVDEGGGPTEIARLIRKSWLVPDGPVDNLTDLCERAGIIVAWFSSSAPIDGVTMSVRDIPSCVFLNRNAPADRMRFSLAHELGHVIMHRVPTDSIEDEANAFASELLVPEKAFKRSLLGQKVTLEWLARQKAYWRVSMQSLLYRASSLGLVTRHQSEYLWMKISSLGWRTAEPEETSFSHERPTIFPKIVSFHSNELGYSVDDLVRLLNHDAEEICDMYGEHLTRRHRLKVIK